MRVFAQRETTALDLAEIARATLRYFEATIDVQSQAPDGTSARLLVASARHGYQGLMSLSARLATASDLAAARAAEERGRAGGMASLAARCPIIWQVERLSDDCELAQLNLCAILASVALGPVLPDDGSTLYGIRGAMTRLEALLAAASG